MKTQKYECPVFLYGRKVQFYVTDRAGFVIGMGLTEKKARKEAFETLIGRRNYNRWYRLNGESDE